MSSSEFHCVYFEETSGDLVLKIADDTYSSLIADADVGKSIYRIYDDRYADFMLSVYRRSSESGKILAYMREAANDGRIWLVNASAYKDKLICTGRIITGSGLFAQACSALSGEKAEYLGTLIAVKTDMGYVIESCSEELTLRCPTVRKGTALNQVCDEYLAEGYPKGIPEICIVWGRPSDICLPMTNGRICGFHLTPLKAADADRVIITVSRGEEALLCRRDTAFWKICGGKSDAYIERMNSVLEEMLVSGNVLYDDICNCELVINCRDTGITRKTIYGSDGASYVINTIKTEGGVFAALNRAPKALLRSQLSERELDIIHLAADGMSNKYIAHLLGITEGTVKKTLHNGFVKLGISSRAELIKLFCEGKLYHEQQYLASSNRQNIKDNAFIFRK